MPRHRYCVAPGCLNAVTPTILIKYTGPMHAFPNKKRFPDRFAQWVQFCERDPGWTPSQSSYICDDHFVNKALRFKKDQAPTIGANMLKDECLHVEDPSTSLPLDKTLELFEDKDNDNSLSSSVSPGKNCLPADRTLDSIPEEIDVDMEMVERDHSPAELSVTDMASVCVPPGWTMIMLDVELVLFAEINKKSMGIERSVGFNSELGIHSTMCSHNDFSLCYS